MANYQTATAPFDRVTADDLGWLQTEFEPLLPNPQYNWATRPKVKSPSMGGDDYGKWPIVVPKTAPAIPPIDPTLRGMMEALWKAAEPQAGAQRGSAGPLPFYAGARNPVLVGTRGMPLAQQAIHAQQVYTPVRPTAPLLDTRHQNQTSMPTDWGLHDLVKRTNAVGFRGDTRSPHQVIVKAKPPGFGPPNTRTDDYYIENNVYDGFKTYMAARFGRNVEKPDYLNAVKKVASSQASKQLLIDYTAWRRIVAREATHLGRMVENELLKAYISCSRCIDSSVFFGTAKLQKDGWLYLVVVHGGFVVPFDHRTKVEQFWGTGEAEIAQLGTIPPERIVGFCRLDQWTGPVGPIFMRKTFRKSESAAFETMFDFMSGKVP